MGAAPTFPTRGKGAEQFIGLFPEGAECSVQKDSLGRSPRDSSLGGETSDSVAAFQNLSESSVMFFQLVEKEGPLLWPLDGELESELLEGEVVTVSQCFQPRNQ